MRLAGNSRFFFFVGWVAWWLAGWGLVYGEYLLRAKVWLTPYGVEAWLAMLAPLAAFGLADLLVMRLYERIWFTFTREALGPVVVEREAVDRLREELRRHPLLRWATPPESRSLGAQLMTAALWLPALSLPEGSAPIRRYGEWLLDGLHLCVLVLGVVVAIEWPNRAGLGFSLIVLSTGLIGLGYSLVRLAARRQAILDYFSAWRAPVGSIVVQ